MEDVLDRLNKHLTNYNQIAKQVAYNQQRVLSRAKTWPKHIKMDVDQLLSTVNNLRVTVDEIEAAVGIMLEDEEALVTMADKSSDTAQISKYIRNLIGSDPNALSKLIAHADEDILRESILNQAEERRDLLEQIVCGRTAPLN